MEWNPTWINQQDDMVENRSGRSFVQWIVFWVILLHFNSSFLSVWFLLQYLSQLIYLLFHFLSEAAGDEGKKQFLQEIDLMKQIGFHRNVLSMLGYWVRSEPILLILEYVPHGDLLQWLRKKRQVRNYKIVAKTIIL